MKIVIAVHHFPPRYKAGAELRVYDAAIWLQQQGHQVYVVCIEYIDRGPDDGLLWEDTEYDGIPVRRLSFDLAKAPDKFRWEYDNPWIEQHLGHYLAQLKPDVFHLFSGYLMGAGAGRAAKTLGIPLVITLTDFWFLCPRLNLLRPDGTLSDAENFDPMVCARCTLEESRRFRIPAKLLPKAADWFWPQVFEAGWGNIFNYSKLVNQFEQRNQVLMDTLAAADTLVCPSRFLLEKFRARGVNSDKLVLNSHGLDTSSWLPVSEPDEADPVFRVGYLGQLNIQKGVHLLVEAFSQLHSDQPLELVIYGDEKAFPDYTQRLRKLAGGNERVKIVGRYQTQDIARILAHIDVVVIPSTWNEIGPLVLYEALQVKTPVLASNIPNMSDVVQHEKNGLLFACGSSTDLAYQLQRLIDEPGLPAQLQAGIEPVKSLADEMMTLAEIYHSLSSVPT